MPGRSMGGMHTLQFGVPHPNIYGSIGLFSIGLLDADQIRYLAEFVPLLFR